MILYIFMSIRKYIYMLQQNFYNENNRYIKWLFNQELSVIDFLVLLITVFSFLSTYFMFGYIILFVLRYFEYKNEQKKLSFNITRRVKCLFGTSILIYVISFILLRKYMMFYNIIILLNPFVIYLANIINIPLEKFINNYLLNKSKEKLNSLNVDVIGVTGSYGKTSTKNILNDILNEKYNSIASIKNYNTIKGLSIMVDKISKFDDYFIAEMGAYRPGSIKRSCDFVNPKYGIVTNIGLAHLETFKSQENILNTKFELVESLPSDGVAVLNYDDELQRSYKLREDLKVLWFGFDKKADVYASNVTINGAKMEFDVTFKKDKVTTKFKTNLLGDANIYNILASLTLANYLGVDKNKMVNAVAKLKATEHRLELKKLSNYYIIDDAYNSNPVGAKMALDVLAKLDGVKVVVTPGMIEFGDKQDILNKELGVNISKSSDYVILVGENQTKPIYEGLIESGYDKDKIKVINDVKEAFNIINDIVKKNKKMVYALFENDLPDIFNE